MPEKFQTNVFSRGNRKKAEAGKFIKIISYQPWGLVE